MKENSDLSEGLPKTLVLFLHTITVLEATGEKMAPKPETMHGCVAVETAERKFLAPLLILPT